MNINDFDREPESTEKYLAQYGIESDAIQVAKEREDEQDFNRKPESPEKYLAQYKVKSDAIQLAKVWDIYEKVKERKYDKKHRRTSRGFILLGVGIISTLIPIWFLVLLTLSGLPESGKYRDYKLEFTERLQFGILGAGILDYLGLCYIIVSDLFPDGKAVKKRDSFKEEDDDEND